MKIRVAILLLSLAGLSMADTAQAQTKKSNTLPPKAKTTQAAERRAMQSRTPDVKQLNKMIARFAAADMKADTSSLSAGDKKALVKLIEAAHVVDDIFLTQLWKGNHDLYNKLKADKSPLGKARLQYFWLNKGPWSSLDGEEAFLPGVPPRKLPGANFYPENMTKDEFESWVKTLPADQQTQARGFFTVITRGAMTDKSQQEMSSAPVRMPGGPAKQGGFSIVPFSEAYKVDLQKAAKFLKEAASLTDNATLKKFLTSRADAFLSNDYYESDLAWMDLDAPLDITIGPYETYNDEIFGYKASYEVYVNLRDEQESGKLAAFSGHLQEIENNLPIDERVPQSEDRFASADTRSKRSVCRGRW